MATATAASDEVVVVPDPSETVAARILRFLAKAPLNLLLIVIAVFWLVPTIGLFFTSLMSANDFASIGWWKLISNPHIATWDNYSNLVHHTSIPVVAVDHRADRDRRHDPADHHRLPRRLRLRVARIPGSRLGLHRSSSACSSCRCRWR